MPLRVSERSGGRSERAAVDLGCLAIVWLIQDHQDAVQGARDVERGV